METLKLFGPPTLLIGVWAVLAAGSLATLVRFPFPAPPTDEAPLEQRLDQSETAPYVSSVSLPTVDRAS